MEKMVRTRFAPSPTGFMHVGGIRTALFAWLIARQNNGQFILRIEDTDKTREVEGSAEHIIKCLDWLGLKPDEGPYFQSKRLDLYNKWAEKLIEEGRAYADPYSADEVQSFREQAQKENRAFLFRNHRPENPTKWDGKTPLRFKSDPKPYGWQDEVMGEMHSGPEVVDDIIIMKSDGFPTYNFAHIIDDAEMKITHVIRGQEFLASTPNYLNIYEALGLTPPIFASVPPIMNEQGNKKLSKRDGAKDILAYRDEGYLPEAMSNFLASLGWNDGTEQEIFTTDQLIEKFNLNRVQKSGARFDEKRLLWLNGAHIRMIYENDPNLLYRILTPIGEDQPTETRPGFWPIHAYIKDKTYQEEVLKLAHDRLKFLKDMEQFDYFFAPPSQNINLISDNKQLNKLSQAEISELLSKSWERLQAIDDWTADNIQKTLNQLLETTGQKPAVLFSLIRIYTTWASFSPQLNDTLALLGKATVCKRLLVKL